MECFKFANNIQATAKTLRLCFEEKQQVGEDLSAIEESECFSSSSKTSLRKLLPKTASINKDCTNKLPPKDKTTRLYKCLECCEAFKSFKLLCRHEQEHKALYSLSNIHICQFCHLCFAQENALNYHLNEQHADSTYNCVLCCNKNAFQGKGFLMQHIKKQHQHEFLQYYCAECVEMEILANVKELEAHFSQKHLQIELNNQVTSKDVEEQQNNDEDYMDLEMHEEFLDEFLLAHTNENSFQFSECWDALDLHLPDMLQSAQTPTAENAVSSQQAGRTKAFLCTHCPNQFEQPQKLLQHLAEIHDLAVLVCKTCQQSFKTAKGLKEHRMEMYCKDTIKITAAKIPCPNCEKSFKSTVQLKQHLRTIHTQLKRHICQLCDRLFSTLDHLKKHVLSQHQNERKYICEQHGCGKGFSQLCHLKEHALTHGSSKSLQCSECTENFWHKVDLKNHWRKMHKGN